jgi:hypothetical protein
MTTAAGFIDKLDFVETWTRGIVFDDAVIVYGWTPWYYLAGTERSVRDLVLVQFDRVTGAPTWWFTSSAKHSERLSRILSPGVLDHQPCVSFKDAMKALEEVPA